MLVDASNVPASSILAIVATLGSVALLSCLGRVCSRGRRRRSRGTDDWLLGLAALCVVGDLVLTVLRVKKQAWSGEDHAVSILVWVETLVQILGVGLVKLSVALTVLNLAVKNWHRTAVLGYICLITVLTVLWFGSALLFGGPITVDWSATTEPEAIWRLLAFVNSVLDTGAAVLIALLPLPLLWTSRPRLPIQITLLAVYTFTTAAIACASLRTYLLHTHWQTSTTTTPLTTLCSSIELTTGTLAASLLTLPALLAPFRPRLTRPLSKRTLTSTTPSSPRSYPTQTYASTDTVLHHPAPSLLTLRFHDTESNLDFDIATLRSHPASYAPSVANVGAPSAPPHSPHNRTVSSWSQVSGFTYFASPAASAAQSIHERSPRRSRVVSVHEMEARTRVLGRRGGKGESRAGDEQGSAAREGEIGVAFTTLCGAPERDDAKGEEMAELPRVSADGGERSEGVSGVGARVE